MTNQEQIGARLKEFLVRYRLTQLALSKVVGVTAGFISQVVTGKDDLSMKVMNGLVEHYPELNLNWIMKGMGEMLIHESHVSEPTVEYKTQPARVAPIADLEKLIQDLIERIEALEKQAKKRKRYE